MFRIRIMSGLVCALLSAFSSADELVVSNWDGYMAADAISQFNEQTDNQAELVLHATNEEIMGKLIASKGKGYDIVFVSSPFAEVLHKMGLTEDLDHSRIPNIKNLYAEANQLPHDPGNHFSIPYAWGTTGLCYRSDLIDKTPTSWMDLLTPDKALDGKTTMLSTDRWLLAAGFLAKGYSVNETDESRVHEVRDLLIDTKKTLLAYDETTFYAKLVSGEAELVQAWDGWCNYGIGENASIRYMIPKEGSDLWVDTMVIMKNSEHKDAAYAFVNYILAPENHGWAAQNILYKVPNKPAMEALTEDFLSQYPNMAIAPTQLMSYEQLRDVGKSQRLYSRTVSEIKAAN